MGGKIDQIPFKSGEDVSDFRQEFEIDYPIVNCLATLGAIPDTDLALEVMRASNDLLINEILAQDDDLMGLAVVAPQKPEKAAEEIDRVASEDQIVGTFICSTGPFKPLGNERYDIMYAAMEDHGLPPTYHGSAAGAFITQFPLQNAGLEKFLPVHVLSHTWSSMITLVSLITNGTPEKFPDLNFMITEAGLGWVPYITYRMNKEYAIRKSEAPLLQQSPEKYIRDQFYFGSQPLGEPEDPDDMEQLIDLVGLDSVCFASDYPHWDFDHPDALEQHLRSQYSAEGRQQILYENPKEAYGLDHI
jgi:predicted TIM-barrel fold metal-dependent hydrolase